jgi:hypothetical protein
VTEDERNDIKDRILIMDEKLRAKQLVWETPRNLAILVGAVAAVSGLLGFKLGQREPAVQPVYLVQPPTLK